MKPAKPAGERENTAALTPSLGTRPEIVGEDGSQFFALRAGMIAVNPQGAWHRFHSSEGVTVMFATPNPSEHIELDVDDPRTVERKPA